MMRIVGFADKIGDGELDLMNPKPLRLVFRSQTMTIAQVQEDRGGLTDDDISVF